MAKLKTPSTDDLAQRLTDAGWTKVPYQERGENKLRMWLPPNATTTDRETTRVACRIVKWLSGYASELPPEPRDENRRWKWEEIKQTLVIPRVMLHTTQAALAKLTAQEAKKR